MLTDHLPDWMRTYVRETADELQAPEDAVALLSLGAVSTAINGGASVMPVAGWTEPLALYTLTLLASGEGKSPVFARLLDPVSAAFAEVTGVNQAEDAKYQTARNRLNKKYIRRIETQALNQVVKGELSREEAIAVIAAAEREVALFNSTAVPLKVLTDVTPAFLMDALGDNDGRVVIASPEAEAILGFRGASKEAILKGFDGETMTKGRKTEGEVTIKRPVINMMLAMQPAVLGALGVDMVNRGVMPRFLIAFPESKVGHRASRPKLVTPEAEAAYLDEMTRIVRTYSDREVKYIAWQRAAVREIGTWRDEIEPLIAPDGMLGSIAAWASKVRGAHFIRLAGLLAIANGRDEVNLDDTAAAKAILRSLMIDAKRAFGEMGASFADDDLVHLMGIAGKVVSEPGQAFSKRDVMRKSNRFMASAERCSAALDKAVEEGLLARAGRGYTIPES